MRLTAKFLRLLHRDRPPTPDEAAEKLAPAPSPPPSAAPEPERGPEVEPPAAKLRAAEKPAPYDQDEPSSKAEKRAPASSKVEEPKRARPQRSAGATGKPASSKGRAGRAPASTKDQAGQTSPGDEPRPPRRSGVQVVAEDGPTGAINPATKLPSKKAAGATGSTGASASKRKRKHGR